MQPYFVYSTTPSIGYIIDIYRLSRAVINATTRDAAQQAHAMAVTAKKLAALAAAAAAAAGVAGVSFRQAGQPRWLQPAALPADAAAYWDFSTPDDPLVDTVHGYTLRQANASKPVGIVRLDGGGFARAAAFGFGPHGHRLYAPRDSVPALAAISGRAAEVSVVAWVKLIAEHPLHGGAYIGGVWEEDRSWRQYAVFMDHTGSCKANNGLVAHVSAEGGPSPGQRYCESRACGATALQPGAWHCVANTYDGRSIKAFVNGSLDTEAGGHDSNNPFVYPDPPRYPHGGIFTPPFGGGANFSMGANLIHDGGGVGSGHLGNEFVGLLGAFAVFNRSLEPAELGALCDSKLRSVTP